MRLGIFGGTFDPPHLGHLIAAQEIHAQLDLDRLLLIPAAVPPHKRDSEITPAPLRLEMLEAAVGADDRFRVSDIEIRREGLSYTVDTLRALREEWPDAALYLAIGADQVAELDSWRSPDEVTRLATIAAFAREGQEVPEVTLPGGARPIERVAVPFIEISSTEIRRRVRGGEPFSYLVPAPVEAIIRRDRLYGAGAASG